MTAHPKSEVKTAKIGPAGKALAALVVFVSVGVAGYLFYQQKAQAQGSEASEPTPAEQRVAVVTTPAAKRTFERSLAVQGNVEAKHFAMVAARIPGVIEAIYVDEGDPVIAGQTKLFETDAVALTKNVQINQHALKVAQCAQREAEANLDKTKVDFHKAKLDYERFERLYAKEAVTADAFEQQQSRYEQLEAVVKLATAQVDLTAAQVDQAQAALAIAEKDLADATIYAPINGTISARLREPGEMGDPELPVFRIDDTSVLEVAAFLPAQYYGAVVPNQTAMRIQVSGIDLGSQLVTYKSPTIHPKLRVFEVKCLLKDSPAGVAPGAMAQIVAVLDSREGLGVPVRAIQQRGGGSVVFVVEGDTVRQKTVKTGFENAGWIELLEADLKDGAAIVTMGQYMVEEGTSVSVQQERK